ncbi:MAG: hypothetical protein ACU84Q_02900 [Gammaproteobacteria bacterium]
MSLESELSKIREWAKEKIPADSREYMLGEVEKLRESGILNSVIKVGDKLPPFSLKNERGETINSDDCLADGGLVLTVFRGHW